MIEFDTHDANLVASKVGYADGVRYSFLAWTCGVYFRDTSLVIEHVKLPRPDIDKSASPQGIGNFMEIKFPVGFSILDAGKDYIVYGIAHEIEIRYTHPETWLIKAEYTIYSDKWLEFDIGYSIEKDVVPELYKTGSTLTNMSGETPDKIEDCMRIVPPKETFVTQTVGPTGLHISINAKDQKYPIIFDPTIVIDGTAVSANFDGLYHSCARLSTGRIYFGYPSTATAYRVAYSDDEGKTWDSEGVGSSAFASYINMALCVDSADKLAFIYITKSGAGNYGVAYRTKAFGGAWSGESFIVNEFGARPYLRIDAVYSPDGTLNVVWYYWSATAANCYTYYTNDVDYSWPETAAANQSLRINDTNVSTYASVDTDANGDSWIAHTDNDAKRLSLKIYDLSAATLGARTDIDTTGTTANDLRWNVIRVNVGNAGFTYIVYENVRDPSAGNRNVKYSNVNPAGMGHSEGNVTNKTGGAWGRYEPSFCIDENNVVWVFWIDGTLGTNDVWMRRFALTTGAFPGSFSPIYGEGVAYRRTGAALLMPGVVDSYQNAIKPISNNVCMTYHPATSVVWLDQLPKTMRRSKRESGVVARHTTGAGVNSVNVGC